MMRPMLVALATALAVPAFAQSDSPRVGGAAFSGFKTYRPRNSIEKAASVEIIFARTIGFVA
jgi:hypothetical protein